MTISSITNNPSTTTNANPQIATGVAAPATDAQKADQAATRVVQTKETANFSQDLQGSEQKRFQAVRQAAQFVSGENAFLNDIVNQAYTIYNSGPQYIARFTDLSTGAVTVKTESELFAQAGNNIEGSIISGTV
jgi:hypothetical protein